MEEKVIGVYMDHMAARLIEPRNGSVTSTVIKSDFDHAEKEYALSKSEHIMHNKENREQHDYYRKIGGGLRNFKRILLFGPTQAKNELYNLLMNDPSFAGKEIHVKETDKIQVDEQDTIVRDHFDKVINP